MHAIWDTGLYNFFFVPGHHPRFKTSTNPFPCQIANPFFVRTATATRKTKIGDCQCMYNLKVRALTIRQYLRAWFLTASSPTARLVRQSLWWDVTFLRLQRWKAQAVNVMVKRGFYAQTAPITPTMNLPHRAANALWCSWKDSCLFMTAVFYVVIWAHAALALVFGDLFCHNRALKYYSNVEILPTDRMQKSFFASGRCHFFNQPHAF